MDIFDSIESQDESYPKIIYGLIKLMNRNTVSAADGRLTIGKDALTPEVLKQLLGDLETDKNYKLFVNSFFINLINKREKKENKEDMGFYKNQLQKQADQMNTKLMKFTDDLWVLLDKISRKSSDIVWAIYELDSNATIPNKLGIEELGISDMNSYFSIKRGGKPGQMKIAQFIRYYFKDRFTQIDINRFISEYNKIVDGSDNYKPYVADKILKPRDFKYEPKNVRETFISLVTETYPYGHEDELLPYLPKDLKKDKHGNYYMVVGDSDTVFTCHLDTASRTKSKVNLVDYNKDGDSFLKTNGSSILGADDKSGVAIILYMIAHNVPGVYWFFLGEERGGIGSGKVVDDYLSYPFMKNKKKMISFDRRNYYSVITEQMSTVCCSNEFASSLCDELNKSGLKMNLDPTGIFTDSANFIEVIPECTNVSVGYFNEHTHDEIQNITFLERLAEACVAVDWDKLVVKRKIGFDDEVMTKFSKLIRDFKRMVFYNMDTIKGVEGKLTIDLEINDTDVSHFYKDMVALQELFDLHRLDPDIQFDEEHIKIVL